MKGENMEAYEVKFSLSSHYDAQKAYAFAISAASAIKKVCRKFKLSDSQIISCIFLGKRTAV